MGRTHSWTLRRAFTDRQWERVVAEAKRIVIEAEEGACRRTEGHLSQIGSVSCEECFQPKTEQADARLTVPTTEAFAACRCESILLAGPKGTLRPFFGQDVLALNGRRPNQGGSFVLFKKPIGRGVPGQRKATPCGSCETGGRPYAAVVVSILAAAHAIAPKVIEVHVEAGDLPTCCKGSLSISLPAR